MGVLKFKHIFFGSAVELSGVFQIVFIFLLIPCCLTANFRAPPVIPNVPFLWAWNAPTEFCLGKSGEPLDMSLFSLFGSPRKNKTGQGITIFYVDRLGYYPYIDPHTGAIVHGRIPQLGPLQQHLTKLRQEILYYMPKDNVGLAVIDWEEWLPTWLRNWKPKDIYRIKSIELVKSQHPQYNHSYATEKAKRDFEKAGKDFMEETLKLGRLLRPNHLWGYYLFPDCYNHHYDKPNLYKGSCFDIEKKRNDDLSWLWKESTALFPSVYLTSRARSATALSKLYVVRNRVHEAIRVSKIPDDKSPLPNFVYTRLVFTDQIFQFLSHHDLVYTIGEIVALGASGIVVWGSQSLARSMKSCLHLDNYMKTILNPYLINVTLAAKMCNQVLCQEQGVCTRKNWNPNDYLHLNPGNFAIQLGSNGTYKVDGKPTLTDLEQFSKNFQCSCYTNLNCKERTDMNNVRTVNVCAVENVCIDTNVGPQAVTYAPKEKKDVAHILSNTTSINSSTTMSLPFPRKHVSGCLLVLCMYSQYLNICYRLVAIGIQHGYYLK
uniref:Hyaluronidase PH-20 n=1 Tax=Oryctolagus cuniculus TaxID=9986 RepID=HYALP_RABIT|nr:RecName: Full=Hyaluronidase PH-20; Short=Hyal-PH20; AltName: Full=Hyaluronoglucosaminidase PH-20; AltName: Full=Sperm adhesion molecule 1; AltName: Full=Sperm surface protein PH-20; Flags: Precursor [Oryctolagus cuniculus]AAA88913.1 PH-20 protein [Oryctolagus cuniculus]